MSDFRPLSERGKELVETTRARVRDAYGSAIGRPAEEVVTPALLLDLQAATRNIKRMAEALKPMASKIRPHIKVHKSPELARLQEDAGASGVSVATVWEAIVMAGAGLDDIFVINTVAGPSQVRLLSELARERRVLVAVDDIGNARAISIASQKASSKVGVLIEVDTGMDRAGVDTEAEAVALAREVSTLPGITLEGVTGYEGHCSLTPDASERAFKQRHAMEFFVGVAGRIESEVGPMTIRSAGGTATWEWTANFPGITEIQAGSYVVMDSFHKDLAPEFERALTVAATVVSRPSGRVIIDAGSKTVAAPDLAVIEDLDLKNVRFDEEHGVFADGPDAPDIGDVVKIVPGYAPSTVTLFEAYHVVQEGEVVDIWPVVPRGPGHHGLVSP
jgi:D-serine deaminase-like pyridoxal phosphate-dependent protein